MKKILSLLILTILISCSLSKYHMVYFAYLDSKVEGNRFIDSIQKSVVDTVIGYCDGCSGCIQSLEKPYFIYWKSKNNWYLTKFTMYSKFNQIAVNSSPVNYLMDNIDRIENGRLKKSQYEMSHFPYDVIRIILNGKAFEYEIRDYEKLANESAQKVILIDKIRSNLLDVRPNEWKGLNYKSEKIRKESS